MILPSSARSRLFFSPPTASFTNHVIPALPYFLAALLLLPGRFFTPAPAFIFFTENPLPSALLCASLLLANRFLPPNPYLASFFERLAFGGPPPWRRACFSLRAVSAASSRATSKRSSSFAFSRSAPWRSI